MSRPGNPLRLLGVALFLSASVMALALSVSSYHRRNFDRIEIRGTARFQDQVAGALTLLKTRSPPAYAVVTNHIGAIAETKRSGMAAWKQPPTFELSDTTAYFSLTWCAISIAHDSLHAKMYHDYLNQHPGRRVPDYIWSGEEAERRCCDYQLGVAVDIGAPELEVNHSRWDPNDRYWEVPFNKVNW